jgi:hypothetical protein
MWSCVELQFAENHGYIQEIKEAEYTGLNFMVENTNTEAQEVKKQSRQQRTASEEGNKRTTNCSQANEINTICNPRG